MAKKYRGTDFNFGFNVKPKKRKAGGAGKGTKSTTKGKRRGGAFGS